MNELLYFLGYKWTIKAEDGDFYENAPINAHKITVSINKIYYN